MRGEVERDLRRMRRARAAGRTVLPGVRRPPIGRRHGPRASRGELGLGPDCHARRRAAPGLGPLRRPRRLHDARGGARPGGDARAAHALLRPRARASSTATAARSRSSSATRSWPSGARRRRSEDDAERAVRAALDLVDAVRALGPRRSQARAGRPDRRGRRHARRRRPGHGRRRPREHRVPAAVGGGARHRARRRGDPARGVRRDRLRARRRAAPQGQGRPRPRLAGAARSGRARRPSAGRDARGAVRRPRRRAAPPQGPLPRHRPRGPRPTGLSDRAGGDRQDPPRLGVPEVHRRAGRAGLVARGPLPRVRRGDQLLGPGRDGPMALRPARRPTTKRRPAPRSPRRCASTSPTRPSDAGSSRALLALLGVGRRDGRVGRAVRGLAHVLRAARRPGTVVARVRGPPLRRPWPDRLRRPPARVEPGPSRSTSSPSPGPSCSSGGPTGARQAQLHLARPRAAHRGGDARAPRRARAGPPATTTRAPSSPAPTACRSTRSRPCGCSSPTGGSRSRRRATCRSATSATSPSPRRSPRSSPPPRRPRSCGARPRPGRRGPRTELHPRRARCGLGRRPRPSWRRIFARWSAARS